MSTVALRLEEAHEHLLKLYTSIPVLTPCLEQIKSNQAEFIAYNNRLRQLQETIVAAQYRVDKARKQVDSVFTINRSESEKAYQQEINDLKTAEDERRACLRQRDEVVSVRYRLHKERTSLLEETRQLKKLTESVFDRSKDEVANADFPEELYWQLELKEYDLKITDVSRQVSKYNTALSNLARAANLSEAALMAFLGYPDAAYKVWKVEYALKASQKMRLYLRVELSLSNAYSNESAAREAVPNILPPLTIPVKPSAVQNYFEYFREGKSRYVRVFDAEQELRVYISQLRTAHRSAELLLAQETERLTSMQTYRESIVPLLAKIRRHVFQKSCLGGYRIEGWEDEQGQSLLGTEADILVRGGIHEAGIPSLTRPGLSGSLSQSAPALQRSDEIVDNEEEIMNTRHRVNTSVPDTDDQETSIDRSRPVVVHGGRVVVSTGRAPLSTLSPSNVLGSEILMQVDRERQARSAKPEKRTGTIKHQPRSPSQTGQEPDLSATEHATDHQHGPGPNGFSALGSLSLNNNSGYTESNISASNGEQESRKRISRGLFGFARSRRDSINGTDDAVVPAGPSSSRTSNVFNFAGRNNRSSIDVTRGRTDGVDSNPSQPGSHRRNLPSISISNPDGLPSGDTQPQHFQRTFFENSSLVQLPSWSSPPSEPALAGTPPATSAAASTSASTTPISMSTSRPRVMSMDYYIGIEAVERIDGMDGGSFDRSPGSAPLIPSYEEHHQDQAVDPDMLHMLSSSMSYEGLSSVVEQDEGGSFAMHGRIRERGDSWEPESQYQQQQAVSRVRSRSLSPHSSTLIHSVLDTRNSGASGGESSSSSSGPQATRPQYLHHHHSFSDQTPDGSSISRGVPPPDYAVMPPEYTA